MTDPLLDPSALPFGAPAFDRIAADDFLPALRIAIDEAAAEIAAIVADPAAPDLVNTILALERSGARLGRIRRVFWTISSAAADDGIRAIEGEISALLTRHATGIAHDAALFARVHAVWEARDTTVLDEASRRLVDDRHRGFVRGGALLDANDKRRFAAIDERLADLSTRFGQNVLADEAEWSLRLADDDLDGLPPDMCDAAAAGALGRGEKGHVLTLGRGDVEGFLTFSTRRDLRERVWCAFTMRGEGGAHDNRGIVDDILALRHERAALLGYATYADFALEGSMAKTPAAAQALLMQLWTPALTQVAAEQAEVQALAGTVAIEPWDWRFYAEQVRRHRYALDGGVVKRHLTLTGVRDAAFACAGKLYGIAFTARADIPGWHADVAAWAVTDADGTERGLLYTDYLARTGKHGGAWMGALRVQERLDEPVLPIAYLVANFAEPPAGRDTALSLDEARTLFHEFGHALHALLSDVVYPSQAGTAVPRDFVEFPSKFMEHWIVAPQTLHDLGLPSSLIEAIGHADDFGQGFATVELVASALLDLAVHRSTAPKPDSARIARDLFAAIGMPAAIAPRHGLTHFAHIFDGGYAASYYSYLWSEVLDADAFAAFTERGDLFAPDLAQRYRAEILAVGDSRDPMASFVAFRGRAPDEHALLVDRRLVADDTGAPVPAEA